MLDGLPPLDFVYQEGKKPSDQVAWLSLQRSS